MENHRHKHCSSTEEEDILHEFLNPQPADLGMTRFRKSSKVPPDFWSRVSVHTKNKTRLIQPLLMQLSMKRSDRSLS